MQLRKLKKTGKRMRNKFIDTLCKIAQKDNSIWLLCGDLGYSVLEPFEKSFPDRFINVGIAEQNMIGIAAGIASCGQRVFCYSIANFPTMRCLEQIRNDICYHNCDVTIVSVGAGFAYGNAGYSHYGLEDLSVLSVLPNMRVYTPADSYEVEWVTEKHMQENPK